MARNLPLPIPLHVLINGKGKQLLLVAPPTLREREIKIKIKILLMQEETKEDCHSHFFSSCTEELWKHNVSRSSYMMLIDVAYPA